MGYILYNPQKEVTYINYTQYPYYRLNLLRRRCYEYLVLHQSIPDEYISVIKHGGVGAMRVIITDTIPECFKHVSFKFFSYKHKEDIQNWLQEHPGRKLIPIVDDEGYQSALKYKGRIAAETQWGEANL